MGLNEVNVTVNGRARTGTTEPRRSLADFLRDELGLTGTHLGCEHGVCGACTVLVDGEAIRSCLVLAVQAEGSEITTVEGLEADGVMHPVQEAAWECHSFQCGFCTPGFLMSMVGYLNENPEAGTRTEIREYLSGNICRCSGYETIVDAVLRAAGGAR